MRRWTAYMSGIAISLIAITGTAKNFRKLSSHKVDAAKSTNAEVVDLRFSSKGLPLLPVVVNQQGETCGAWAAGYTLNSFLQGQRYNQIPDRAETQCSAEYVWNLLNQKQKGTNLLQIAELLKEVGCPTTPTLKLGLSNSAFANMAVQEAAKYKIENFHSITTLAEIKASLRQGRPILIGTRLDPVFVTGGFHQFTSELRQAGNSILREFQKTNSKENYYLHAMVIVGFDDHKQALIVRNSYGLEWGQNGDTYVSYALVEHVDRETNGTGFLKEALVATTAEAPVKQSDPALKLGIVVASSTKNTKKPSWSWELKIDGYDDSTQAIQSVAWRLPNTFKQSHKTGIKISGVEHTPGIYPVYADIKLKNGTTYTKTAELYFEDPTHRSLQLGVQDRYIETLNGQSRRQWTAMVLGEPLDLQSIASITYTTPNEAVTRLGSRAEVERSFAQTGTSISNSIPILAEVKFKDGTTKTLQQTAELTSPSTQLNLKSSIVATGMNTGSLELKIVGDASKIKRIKSVDYKISSAYGAQPPILNTVNSSANWFALNTSGSGKRIAQATVHYTDGSTELTQEEIVDFRMNFAVTTSRTMALNVASK